MHKKTLSIFEKLRLSGCCSVDKMLTLRSKYEGDSVSLGDYTHKEKSQNGSPSSPMVLYKVNPSLPVKNENLTN